MRETEVPTTRYFADVVHQFLVFDASCKTGELLLELIDSSWLQRLRDISQTGNARLVYMFAEHSRFGHCLGAAHLAVLSMDNLKKLHREEVEAYYGAVACAALLHDLGHTAPGSHLAEKIWHRPGSQPNSPHEGLTLRILKESSEIRNILSRHPDPDLLEKVIKILSKSPDLPQWTKSIIHGDGWNIDRGNWTFVDSEMCGVSYGTYNILALVDALRISPEGKLVLLENRRDALTHFLVARHSMYRQIYQHRVLQAADLLCDSLVLRLRDLLQDRRDKAARSLLGDLHIFCDETMLAAILSRNYCEELSLEQIFEMTESWWGYHLLRWSREAKDPILRDLSYRLTCRKLLKTMQISREVSEDDSRREELLQRAREVSKAKGFEPRYYVREAGSSRGGGSSKERRGFYEDPPMIKLESGSIVEATFAEPLLAQLLYNPGPEQEWVVLPREVKGELTRLWA